MAVASARRTIAATCLLLGCGSAGGSSDDGDASVTVAGTGATGIDLDAGSDPKLDVGGGDVTSVGSADDGGNSEGCSKVDVIFAVDNSGSMSEEHDALTGPVFDSFPQALLAINGGIEDFQLGVIDACPKPAFFHDTGNGGACNYSTGTNFMISSSPNLAAEFSCVTDFSATGYMSMPDMCLDDGAFGDDDEQPGLTAARAVSDPAVSGPNAGFLRDDALLFIVAITDEDEEVVDAASVQEIYDTIVAAKGGDVGRVVYLGIAGDSACDGPYGTAIDATQSKALTALFADQGRGMFWDLCQGDLPTAFETAISTIVDSACQQFPPVG